MAKALDGLRILDFTHVQSGPTCTQLLAWFGADVIKVERPGEGDITRGQLRDVPNVDTQYSNGELGDSVPRAGNASGGGQPGWILKCKGWETDPNAYIYFIVQAQVWRSICRVIGKEEWITDPHYAKPEARLPRLMGIFATIEEWSKNKTKFEAMAILNKDDIPCGPILSMKELAEEQSLRETGTVVEVDHPTRGKYLTVGNPIKLSDNVTEVTRSPLLGEQTEEILRNVLRFDEGRIAEVQASGALGEAARMAAE
jgi:formyl-CoA transferase